MTEDVYRRVAQVLDTLPNGFPAAESGVEIKLLKRVFEPDEAELFCDMRLTFETAEQVAERTGRPLEGLEEKLYSMHRRGQLFSIDFGGTRVYRIMPWAVGVYEFQLKRMDREFAELCEEYGETFGRALHSYGPAIMQVLPVEKDIPVHQEALPYEKVSNMIENGQSFMLMDCICKKEKELLDQRCDKPMEVCMAIAPIPDAFDNSFMGRPVSQKEALDALNKAEEAGLVHLTGNVVNDRFYI